MKQNVLKTLFYIVFCLLYFSNNLPAVIPGLGIDPSWHESLAMAVDGNFVFGKDFIFNYGPLGYLNTLVLPSTVSPWFLFFFHSFILLNYLFIIKLCFHKLGKSWILAAILSIVITLPWGFFADASFTLFYLLIFWLLYIRSSRQTIPLLIVITIAVLIFFIKVNLSLIAYGLLSATVIYFGFFKILTWRTVLITLILLLAITTILATQLHVAIPEYLQASLKIIDAYQDAMADQILSKKELFVLLGFEFLIVLVVLSHIFKNLSYFPENFFLYLLIAMAWFLCFKQSHTATGHYNVFGFFLFMPMLAVLIYLFENRAQTDTRLVTYVLLIQLIATQIIRLSFTSYDPDSFVRFYFPNEINTELKNGGYKNLIKLIQYRNPTRYFKKLLNYDYSENFNQKEINKIRLFPTEINEKIGNRSIDILPQEISYLYFNQLYYKPRPVIQTYQANSDWLANKNGERYTSPKAPDLVLANIHEFRYQNAFWVDKNAYISLYKNYELIDTLRMPEENLFLFEKRSLIQPLFFENILNKKTQLDEKISIPEDSILYLKADIHYSFMGKIARLLFQPAYLKCTVEYEDGTSAAFRIPPPILKGGIFISGKINDEEDFLKFYSRKKLTKIKTILFWSQHPNAFQNEFEYVFEKLK